QTLVTVPVGIITECDIVQFQALELDCETLTARMVMSAPVFSVHEDESLWTVQQLMLQQRVNRLAATGVYGELLGIVTQTNVLQALNPLDLYRLAEALEQKVSKLEAEKMILLQQRNDELERQVESRTVALQQTVKQQQLIAAIATQIHASSNLQDILDATIEQVRAFLGCDRIFVLAFQENWNGTVVADAHRPGRESYLGQKLHDPCFAPDWPEPYQLGRIRIVSDIEQTDMATCHRQLLRDLGIRAKILAPVVRDKVLWGLVGVIEHDAPRQWSDDDVSLVHQLVTQLAIAIQRAVAYETAQIELAERQRAEIDLRHSRQKYASLAEISPVGIFRTDPDGHYLYVNERWCQMVGQPPETAIGSHWSLSIAPEDRASVLEKWATAKQNQQPLRVEYQLPSSGSNSDTSGQWVFAQIVAELGLGTNATGYVGTITDISDRKQVEQQLIHNALHDTLTNLPNRKFLMQRLEQAIENIRADSSLNFAVLFLDLDRFKIINDSLGHLIGDEVLLTVAQLLQSLVQAEHMAARLGGDEFVVLIENLHNEQDAIRMAENILVAMDTPLEVNNREIFLSASIGVVWGTQDYFNASDLIRDADIAMYQAKAWGRNRYVLFDSTMHARAVNRLDLDNDLHKALENQEFRVVYQPIIELNSLQILGFESLIRWHHPTRGFVSPNEFIPLAEETGLIVELDRWVLYEACRQLVQWQQNFPQARSLKMSVNLSVQDLRRDTVLVDDISQIIALTGLDYRHLNLEITEGMVIDDITRTIDILAQLQAKKIHISIDDFGTGYSSLSYLHRLPANTLKIDRSFVSHSQEGDKNDQIVETIVALSQQLGLTVNAEGIETHQQLSWLQTLGCDMGQGYLFSKPLPPSEIEALLQTDSMVVFPPMA
ncbi:MAG: EAL domain-containing protein, partial [Symploca sp. SIO2B6]|nr:EAL domain-containing protein [Symploca sp. SIO2B6]